MLLSIILKDSDYRLAQFSEEKIQALESQIVERNGKYFVNCLIRKKDIRLTPEEVIRQLYVMTLLEDFAYPASRIELEYGVSFGREVKRADIVVFDKDNPSAAYIIVELKKPKLKDGKEQLKGYCNATGAPIGVWTNGESISYYHRKDPNFFEDLSEIPRADQKLSDILSERWTIDDLIKKDKLITERKSLKDLILEMEDEVLANAGVDVFEELFKLIFTKLYDEMQSGRNKDRHLEFRNYGDTETELKNKIQTLFDKAKKKWDGVFSHDAKIMLTPSHLSICIASLQDVKLFNSNLEVVDEAFEYLINKSSKGEKGQYFTPRYVIDMCVKMLNPQRHETMIDTAAGSCGFPVHTIFYVWEQILIEKGLNKSHLFTLENKPQECIDYVNDKVFAIDFDERAVRVARTLNLIAGDGQTNVLNLNTLDWERWDEKTKDEEWIDVYNAGWKGLKELRAKKDENRLFQFDLLMANPPFAGDIKESRILAKYELGKNATGKYQTKVGRDILFIERNLDFLKPGGRMAIVLPQGRFNNSSDKQIRQFIAERCRILAIVGLHGNVFKPHTGTKTSVLFVQKWNDDPDAGALCPKKEDYPIFFATMQEPSKDNSGEKIYVRHHPLPLQRRGMEGCRDSGGVVNSPQPPLPLQGRGMEGCPQDGVVACSGRNTQNYMSLPYNPVLKERARELRKAGNLAEVLFWNQVKNKQFKNFDFDRQKIIGNYIVDFFCTNCNVVIEIDGSSHNDKQEYDAIRDEYLKSLGLEVIHVTDTDVKENIGAVMTMLCDHPALTGTPPEEGKYHPLPPPKEGNCVAEPPKYYQTTPKDADEYKLDEHGHLIVKHDLFNHDGKTQDGVAEAFVEFAKKEKLSFF